MSKHRILAGMMRLHLSELDEALKSLDRAERGGPLADMYFQWTRDSIGRVKDALLAATCADVDVEAVEP